MIGTKLKGQQVVAFINELAQSAGDSLELIVTSGHCLHLASFDNPCPDETVVHYQCDLNFARLEKL